MKRIIAVIILSFFLASMAMPVLADELQAKRAENNKNIGEFVSDIVKLPFIVLGIISRKDVDKIKQDLNYKDNQGINNCLRKKEAN